MNPEYSEKDWPFTFYFNGEAMPKWGACWITLSVGDPAQPGYDPDDVIHDRNVGILYCTIDHVGNIESADRDVFIYAVQKLLLDLLGHHDDVMNQLADKRIYWGSADRNPQEIYSGLLESAFRMRELAIEKNYAFWTSGYETDRQRLVETIRRCQLPPGSPEFQVPPHIRKLRSEWRLEHWDQVVKLHSLAQSGQFEKDMRRRLHEISEVPFPWYDF